MFAVNNNIFDVGVMFAMGGGGFVMMRYKVPAAPFLIAFILGPLLEDNFRQSILIGDGDNSIFVRGPITITFWCLTALSLFVLIRARVTAARTGQASVLTTGG